MSSGGHNKKPTHLKRIQGTLRPDRNIPGEPKGKRSIPPCSREHLATVKKEYAKLAALLNDMGVLSESDGGELENLALARVQVRYAQRKFFEQVDRKSFKQWQLVLNDTIRLSSVLSAQFGLDPQSRSRVNVIPKAEQKTEARPFNWDDYK